MSIVHAAVLGIVQGLAEFLPISSSGHLVIVPWLLGWDDATAVGLGPSVKKAFDVALHLGTLVAVIGYFRRDLLVYVRDGFGALRSGTPPTAHGRLAWLLVVSALPAAAAGAVFEEQIDSRLGTPLLVGVSLVIFGLVLWWADRRQGRRTLGEYRLSDALKVGAAQVLSLNPGTSRSGITMTAARLLGFDRDSAARASFLMAVPITFGAVVFKMGGLVIDGVPSDLLAPMAVGVVASGLAGWLAVWGTLRLVRTRTFGWFVGYRVLLGAVVVGLVVADLR